MGAHPYLRLGDRPVGELKLIVNAERHLEVDGWMIPTGEQVPVPGARLDYRDGRLLNDDSLDDTWTGLRFEADGSSKRGLQAPDGSRVDLHMDANFEFIQVFTTPAFPGSGGPVRAVALEPMTAPANAFNNGMGLRWLAPGKTWEASWGIAHRSPQSFR